MIPDEDYIKHTLELLKYASESASKIPSIYEELEDVSPEFKHRMARSFAETIIQNVYYAIRDLNRMGTP
jgi:hypothetical protein